jgi:hypothetical protein
MVRFLAVLIALTVANCLSAQDAAATESRRQDVYQQKVTAAMSHSNGQLVRREIHEFNAVPQMDSTDKQRTSFSGLYRQGKTPVSYTAPDAADKGDKGDLEEIRQLVQDLVNAKNTRDGPHPNTLPL